MSLMASCLITLESRFRANSELGKFSIGERLQHLHTVKIHRRTSSSNEAEIYTSEK